MEKEKGLQKVVVIIMNIGCKYNYSKTMFFLETNVDDVQKLAVRIESYLNKTRKNKLYACDVTEKFIKNGLKKSNQKEKYTFKLEDGLSYVDVDYYMFVNVVRHKVYLHGSVIKYGYTYIDDKIIKI